MDNILQQECSQEEAEKLSEKLALAIHYSTINLSYFRQMMHAQLSGSIVLPYGLGLNQASYQSLRKALNNKELIHKEIEWYKSDWTFIRERAAFCAEMFAMKQGELDELINLLDSYRNKQDPSSEQMAIIVAMASLTNYHLWESLGLSDRSQLGKLIKHNFPKLYALNTENMRWKRFFYRQLCEQGGDYICRSPSCEECKSYNECFV